VNSALFEQLPEHVKKIQRSFRPDGPMSITFDFARRGGELLRKRCVLRPEKMSACFEGFRYQLERITGQLDLNLENDLLRTDLVGCSGRYPVTIRGTWRGEGKNADADLEVTAEEVPLDDKLIGALPEASRAVARSFEPGGRAKIEARVRHVRGKEDFDNLYLVHFRNASLRWKGFPYPVRGLQGLLVIRPAPWEFHDCRGSYKGATSRASGRSSPAEPGLPGGGRIAVEVVGNNVPLDAELKRALEVNPALV